MDQLTAQAALETGSRDSIKEAQLGRNRQGLYKARHLVIEGGCREVVCSHSLGEGRYVGTIEGSSQLLPGRRELEGWQTRRVRKPGR